MDPATRREVVSLVWVGSFTHRIVFVLDHYRRLIDTSERFSSQRDDCWGDKLLPGYVWYFLTDYVEVLPEVFDRFLHLVDLYWTTAKDE
jgi:hypothetical protein